MEASGSSGVGVQPQGYAQLPGGDDTTERETLEATGGGPGKYPVNRSDSRDSPHPLAQPDFRDIINDLLDNPESSGAALAIHYFITTSILVSTAACIVETVPELHEDPKIGPLFFPLEMCITAIFTVEFALRLYACDSLSAFATNAFNLIDFLAIFPGYVEIMILLVDETGAVAPGAHPEDETSSSDGSGLSGLGHVRTLRMIRMVRLVRVIRVMRLAKVARRSQLLGLIFVVFGRVSQSGMVVILMLMGFAMVLSASLIYLFESEHCEDTGVDCTGPSAFESIPSAFWWSIATLTTVGYGDMVPHTVAGKVIGGLTSVLGVIIVAIGIALVTINFRECYTEERARADNQRRGLTAKRGDSEARQQKREQDEIDRLKEEFDTCSKELLQKLKQVRTDDQVLPMLQALEKHTVSFSGDVQDFVKHLLSAKR